MISFNYVLTSNPLNPVPSHCFNCRSRPRMLSKISIDPNEDGLSHDIYLCRECLDTLTRTIKVKLDIDSYKE